MFTVFWTGLTSPLGLKQKPVFAVKMSLYAQMQIVTTFYNIVKTIAKATVCIFNMQLHPIHLYWNGQRPKLFTSACMCVQVKPYLPQPEVFLSSLTHQTSSTGSIFSQMKLQEVKSTERCHIVTL